MPLDNDLRLLWTKCLSKALIQRSTQESAGSVAAAIERQNVRTRHILAILNSTQETRDEVRAQMGVAVTNDPLDDSSLQILYILTAYEMMTAEKKVDFLETFKACGTIASQGSWELTEQNTHQPGHIPPQYEP